MGDRLQLYTEAYIIMSNKLWGKDSQHNPNMFKELSEMRFQRGGLKGDVVLKELTMLNVLALLLGRALEKSSPSWNSQHVPTRSFWPLSV